jgi:hypothetical protein
LYVEMTAKGDLNVNYWWSLLILLLIHPIFLLLK